MSSNWQTATTKPISKILCYYTNSSQTIQLIRVTHSLNINLEKIIFPRQRILFEAIPEGQLEISTSKSENSREVTIIPCRNLEVNQVPQKSTVIETVALYQNKSA